MLNGGRTWVVQVAIVNTVQVVRSAMWLRRFRPPVLLHAASAVMSWPVLILRDDEVIQLPRILESLDFDLLFLLVHR